MIEDIYEQHGCGSLRGEATASSPISIAMG